MGELLRACRHEHQSVLSEVFAAYKAARVENGAFVVSVSGDNNYLLATDEDATAFMKTFLKPYRLDYRVDRFDQEDCDRRAAVARLNELSGGKLIIKQ